MDRMKKALLLLIVYSLFFWVGFRSGEIYNRTKRGFKPETIIVEGKYYYVLEEVNGFTNMFRVHHSDLLIQFLNNEKLKPLLKKKNLEIYTLEGERVY